MKTMSRRIGVAALIGCALAVTPAPAFAETVADVGGDWVSASVLPTGWAYLESTEATGGTEVALAPNQAIGFPGLTAVGFGGGATYNTSAVLGDVNANTGQYEIFSNGFEGSAGNPGNHGVVGTDLLVHPANSANDFTILRYTVSAADLEGRSAGSMVIAGSFRNAIDPAAAGRDSVTASIYHNGSQLFSVNGSDPGGSDGVTSYLSQADGTFNVKAAGVVAGDTISFVVGRNASYSSDETAVRGTVTSVLGDTISINFDSDHAPHAPVMSPTDVAGVKPRANWNNAFNGSFANTALSVTNLGDNLGHDTGARIDWTSGGGSWSVDHQNPALSANHKMMMDHLDARAPGDTSITVSDLPDWLTAGGYDVYVYFDAVTLNGTVISGYTIDDSENPTQTFWTIDTATFDGEFVLATGTTKATATAGANYIRFQNLTGSSFTLLADSDAFRAEVSGIQIVAVPAPASLPAGLCLIALVAARRRP